MLGLKMEATGSYENIEEVTKENIYECTGNEFKCFIKERKCRYDLFYYRNASFYSVDDSRN
jgi:hypothetical protein